MGFLDTLLVGIGLSMDASAVCMTNGIVYSDTPLRKTLAQPLFFGIFQALMPLIGYYTSSIFAMFISKHSGVVVFLILGVIGAKMIYNGFCDSDKRCCSKKGSLTRRTLFFQAFATSIDAFAVGVGLGAMQAAIATSALIIGIVTALCCLIAIWLGKKIGFFLGNKAEILGGLILIGIGIKALF